MKVTVVVGIGVDEHGCRPTLLRYVDFHAAEIPTVTDENDLAVEINVVIGQLLEVFRPSIVGINYLTGHVSRGR